MVNKNQIKYKINQRCKKWGQSERKTEVGGDGVDIDVNTELEAVVILQFIGQVQIQV